MALFSITAKAAGLKAIISTLKNSSEEAQFKINNDGVQFFSAPQGNPFMVIMLWEKNNLDELTLDAEQIIGFRTDDIDKIFKRFTSDDHITISQKEKAHISIKSNNRLWDLRAVSSSMLPDFQVPHIEFDGSFCVDPTELKDTLADVAVFSDTARLVADNGRIHFESSDDSGNARSQLSITNEIIPKDANTRYNLDYLNDVISAVYLICESVKISFSDKKPILLEFMIKDAGTLRYYLAPLSE